MIRQWIGEKLLMMEKYMLKTLKSSGGSSLRTRIDDLPDVLLAEILCRLPNNKLIFQCKLVSKLWYNLISAPYFVSRYLCLQHQMQKPSLLTTLVFFDGEIPRKPVIITSDHPVLKAATSNFALKFLPCYSQAKEIEEPPVVVGTYNDLVLCYATKNYQRDYYLCNPYTKQWVSLPPTPNVYRNTLVGFICDPYFKYNLDHNGEQEQWKTGTRSFIVNADYKWKVVRVILNSSDHNFDLEIFSSATRKWSEILVECSQHFPPFARDYFFEDLGHPRSLVAYNGMLYWWCGTGHILGLDVSDSNIPKYRFILHEDFERSMGLGVLGVCGGRLRLCRFEEFFDRDHDEVPQILRVSELKQVVKQRPDKLKWLVDRVTIASNCKDIKVQYPTIRVLDFHPNNEDIVYLTSGMLIFTCCLREGTLEKISETPIRGTSRRNSYSFSLPWWPTPVL